MEPKSVEAKTLKAWLASGEAVLVDVREPGEHAAEHIAGAALDVFEQEPLPAGGALAGVPNLILTPHIAGLTQEANTRVSDMVAAGVTIALTGGAE